MSLLCSINKSPNRVDVENQTHDLLVIPLFDQNSCIYSYLNNVDVIDNLEGYTNGFDKTIEILIPSFNSPNLISTILLKLDKNKNKLKAANGSIIVFKKQSEIYESHIFTVNDKIIDNQQKLSKLFYMIIAACLEEKPKIAIWHNMITLYVSGFLDIPTEEKLNNLSTFSTKILNKYLSYIEGDK